MTTASISHLQIHESETSESQPPKDKRCYFLLQGFESKKPKCQWGPTVPNDACEACKVSNLRPLGTCSTYNPLISRDMKPSSRITSLIMQQNLDAQICSSVISISKVSGARIAGTGRTSLTKRVHLVRLVSFFVPIDPSLKLILGNV